jgi:four helix bundle protein
MDLAAVVYAVARSMPPNEQFGMTSQMQRAVASVPANIAEGYQRGSRMLTQLKRRLDGPPLQP